jgi:hypothetical protein
MSRIRVDWFRVLAELQGKGYSVTAVASAIDTPKSTVMGWRILDAEPRHAEGELLVGLWCQVMEEPRDALPLNVDDLLSAARATSKR